MPFDYLERLKVLLAFPLLEVEPMLVQKTLGAATETSLPNGQGDVFKAWYLFPSWTDDQSPPTGN